MNTRSVMKNLWPSTSGVFTETEDDIDSGYKANGVLTHNPNGRGKCRLSLMGTAILERENEPLLSASYHYWTDQASQFFHESVQDFRRIELSKVAFGVNGYKERDSKSKLNDGVVYQNAESKKSVCSPCSQTDYLWSQVVVAGEKPKSPSRNWLSFCNSFSVGFASCMFLVFVHYFLTTTA